MFICSQFLFQINICLYTAKLGAIKTIMDDEEEFEFQIFGVNKHKNFLRIVNVYEKQIHGIK